jgi:hypothetical protein
MRDASSSTNSAINKEVLETEIFLSTFNESIGLRIITPLILDGYIRLRDFYLHNGMKAEAAVFDRAIKRLKQLTEELQEQTSSAP